jgi:phosphonate transport system permease protein
LSSQLKAHRSPIIAGVLSFLPGLGHVYAHSPYRGAWAFIAAAVTLGMVAWYGRPIWYFAPVLVWLWAILDAASLAASESGRSPILPILAVVVAAIGIGWDVVQIDLTSASLSRAMIIVQPMLRPDFIEENTELFEGWVPIQMPCSASPPKAEGNFDNGIYTFATPDCVRMGESIIISASGLKPDTDTEIWWRTPIGDSIALGADGASVLILPSDSQGTLTTLIQVPATANISAGDTTKIEEHRIYFQQYIPQGGYRLSTNGAYVFKGISETLALALMATTFAVFAAVPLSFLAARNLMTGNPVTIIIYVVARTLLNFVRSIESLIIAIIFVVIVGLGPFAGMLAITVHSIAALAKLYSEVIEGIDPGPIEAIRATGATWVQVVRYGVIPQIVPPFTAFTIYRWDINVRSSTIVGFVGGGGIGFYLIQWIQINDMRAVSASFIAIAVVVVALDYFSARIRERLL